MFDLTGLLERTRCGGSGSAAHILLQPDHPDIDAAARLLTMQGGSRCLMAAAIVYQFPTALNRDAVLELLRSKMGWTVAEPFDGDPWLPSGDPYGQRHVCKAAFAEA